MSEQSRVSVWYIVVLSAVGAVVDLGYAVEGAYAIPLVLAAGIPSRYASLTLSLSPVFGLIFQPLLGSLTDMCRCTWGRRRPFILLLGLTAVVSSGSLPYYFYLRVPYSNYIIPACVVVSIMVFDWSVSAFLIPAKAIMLDIVPPSQEATVNQVASAGVGVLSCFGFGLGAMNWSLVTRKGYSIQTQAEIVFGVTAAIFTLVVLVTLLCIREKSSILATKGSQSINNYGSVSTTVNSSSDGKVVYCQNECMNPFTLFKNSFIELFQFCYYMSRHFWILFWTFVIAYAADFAFVYSVTIFFGTVVYGGDSKAPVDSDSYRRYSSGVRMGSLGLAIGSALNIPVSLLLEKLMKYVSNKTILLCINALFTCSTCLLMYFHQLPAALVLCSTYGLYLGVCVSVPYGLIANYKRHSLLFRKEWDGDSNVVEGKAATLIATSVLVGQILSTLIISPVVDFLNNENYFMFVPCVQSTIAFLLACCLTSPRIDEQNEQNVIF